MIRIGHIAASWVTLERFVVPLVPRLEELGMEAVLVSGGHDFPGAPFESPTRICVPLGRGRDMWRGWTHRSRVTDAVMQAQSRVLFVHTPATAIAALPTLVSLRRSGVRLIYVARGSLDESSSSSRRAAWAVSDPLRWPIWDGIGVVNDYLEQEALRKGGHRIVRRIGMGGAWPNLPDELPPSEALPPWRERERFTLGWVGRMDRDKRPDAFVDLVSLLRRSYGLPVRGVMVGGALQGDQDARTATTDLVEVVGWYDSPWEVLARCDLNVSTSMREGFGLTPLEAAAVGTPTVAFRNHGMTESVAAVQGALVTRGDVLSMAEWVAAFAALGDDEISERRRSVRAAAESALASADPAADFADLAMRVLER